MRNLRTVLVAGLATLAFPAASLAQTNQSQNVNGVVGSELSITDPADLQIPAMTHAGPNADSDDLTLTTTNATGATITATDASVAGTRGHLVNVDLGPLSQPMYLAFDSGAASGHLTGSGVSHSIPSAGVTNVGVSIEQDVAAIDDIVEGDLYSMVINYSAVENAPVDEGI